MNDSKADRTVLAWVLCDEDMAYPGTEGAVIVPGETMEVETPVVFDEHGFQAAADPLRLLKDVEGGNTVCRVEISGKTIEKDGDVCGSRCRTLWVADATDALHAFACDAAEVARDNALSLRLTLDRDVTPAIEDKRRFLAGTLSGEEAMRSWGGVAFAEHDAECAIAEADEPDARRAAIAVYAATSAANLIAGGAKPETARMMARVVAEECITGVDDSDAVVWRKVSAKLGARLAALAPNGGYAR